MLALLAGLGPRWQPHHRYPDSLGSLPLPEALPAPRLRVLADLLFVQAQLQRGLAAWLRDALGAMGRRPGGRQTRRRPAAQPLRSIPPAPIAELVHAGG